MNKLILLLSIFLSIVIGFLVGKWYRSGSTSVMSPLGIFPTPTPATPLKAFEFETMRGKSFSPKSFEWVEKTGETARHEVWTFKFLTDSGWVTGQAMKPIQASSDKRQVTSDRKFPIIVMIRGYVEKEQYAPGVGTKSAAAVFADAGFLTLAPDFLGYGGSDPEPTSDLEARFGRPLTVLQLISSLSLISAADTSRLGIWAHSNGGNIALSVLEISGKPIPTTLWAPVSAPFPYSILFYTDDIDDHGKYLRSLVSDFEKLYDSERFSLTNYLDWIAAPIQIHQGLRDESVPYWWSVRLRDALKKQQTDVQLFLYPQNDHNMRPEWNTVIGRDVAFFKRYLLNGYNSQP